MSGLLGNIGLLALVTLANWMFMQGHRYAPKPPRKYLSVRWKCTNSEKQR